MWSKRGSIIDRKWVDPLVAAIHAQTAVMQQLLELKRVEMGLTKQEATDVEWQEEPDVPVPMAPTDPNDPDMWLQHSNDAQSFELEQEEERKRIKRGRQ